MTFLSIVQFWFDRFPNQDPTTVKIYFVLFLGLIIAGAGIRMVTKKSQKDRFAREISHRIASLCVVIGAFGLLYWFVAFQKIVFLSSRFWLIVLLGGVIIWARNIIKYATKVVPKERERLSGRKKDRDYMPKKKK
jgi:hypothetical protein